MKPEAAENAGTTEPTEGENADWCQKNNKTVEGVRDGVDGNTLLSIGEQLT